CLSTPDVSAPLPKGGGAFRLVLLTITARWPAVLGKHAQQMPDRRLRCSGPLCLALGKQSLEILDDLVMRKKPLVDQHPEEPGRDGGLPREDRRDILVPHRAYPFCFLVGRGRPSRTPWST